MDVANNIKGGDVKILSMKEELELVKRQARVSEVVRERVRLEVVTGKRPSIVANSVKDDVTYAEVTEGKERKECVLWVKKISDSVRKFSSDSTVFMWASSGVVARVINGEHNLSVQQKFRDAGFDNVKIIPMGGGNVFLTCTGKDGLMSIISEAYDFLNMFFLGLRPWSKNEVCNYERGTWLRLYGIPLHAWNFEFLNLCSLLFGRLLKRLMYHQP